MSDLKELLEHHEKFVKKTVKKSGGVNPMIIFFKDGVVNPTLISGGRDTIIKVLQHVKTLEPEWIVQIFEGYMKSIDTTRADAKELKEEAKRDYYPGKLEKEFKEGLSPEIKDSVIIVVYKGTEKRMVTYEKKGKELINRQELDKFEGSMVI